MPRYPLVWLLAVLLLSGCDRARKNYEAAKNDPVHKVDLHARIVKIEKLGGDYRFHFRLENNEAEALRIRPDFELISPGKDVHYEHTPLELTIPPGQSTTYFDSPMGPASVSDPGYKYFVFKVFTKDEELLVRELHDIPQQVVEGS